MLSIVLEAPERLAIHDRVAPPPPGPGEALVRVLRVGVCGTDLHAYRGQQPFLRYPVVLGHELAVEVVALGAPPRSAAQGTRGVAHPAVGDRCTVVPYLHDGTCVACRRGKPNCCETLSVLGVHVDGGMRDLLLVPIDLLIPANDVDVDALALVEMLAVGAHALRRAAPEADDTVLVIGAGPIGMACIAFARLRARAVVAVDVDPGRLGRVRDLGLATTPDAWTKDLDPDAARAAVRRASGGDLPGVVVDATGSARSMEGAVRYLSHGGRLVFVGHTRHELTFSNPALHQKEASLIFSRNATRSDFQDALGALRRGEVDVAPWITTRAGPDRLVRDLPSWTRPESGVLKALLELA